MIMKLKEDKFFERKFFIKKKVDFYEKLM